MEVEYESLLYFCHYDDHSRLSCTTFKQAIIMLNFTTVIYSNKISTKTIHIIELTAIEKLDNFTRSGICLSDLFSSVADNGWHWRIAQN